MSEPDEREEPVSDANANANADADESGGSPKPNENQGPRRSRLVGLGELSPHEALEKIRRGEMVTQVKIVGLRLKGAFDKPVRFKHVLLINPIFENAAFASDLAFTNCDLESPKFTKNVTIQGNLGFHGSTLKKPSLRKIDLYGTFFGTSLRVQNSMSMGECRFRGRVSFWNARFDDWVTVKGCQFEGDADFRSIHIQSGMSLSDCHFHQAVLFRGATVEKKWDAETSRFDGLLDLSRAKLHDYVYLETIQQGPHQRFAFDNMVGDRVQVRVEQLEGRIDAEQQNDHARAMREFGLLKRNFEALHRYEEEDWAFYHFKVSQRRARPRSWKQPWSKVTQFCDWLLLDLGCGYGANPLRAVRAALLIVLFFGIIYAAGVNYLYIDPDRVPFAGQPPTSTGNRIMIGMLTSVSVLVSGFQGIRDAAAAWMNIPLIFESLVGTLLWGLFIVAFSRKVIR